jgi:excisionase family DNA binding protein
MDARMDDAGRFLETNQMLTPKEIAAKLSISTTAVRALIDKGLLRASNVGTGRNKVYRVSEDDLVAFLDSRSSQRKSNQPIRKGKRIELKEFV